MTLSCNGANFVAQQLDYKMTQGWMEGDGAANQWYSPLESFEERFESLVQQVKSLGFSRLDLWTAQLNWAWATEAHIQKAKEILQKNEVSIASYAGPFGNTREEFEKACHLITSLGCRILGGFCGLLDSDIEGMLAILNRYDCYFALENHPEKTAEEILSKIQNVPRDRIGICLDTGWLGIHQLGLIPHLEELYPHILHVHLKDLKDQEGHNTCAVGKGILALKGVYRFLKEKNYSGGISIEHEPEDRDPSDELQESLRAIKEWEEDL